MLTLAQKYHNPYSHSALASQTAYFSNKNPLKPKPTPKLKLSPTIETINKVAKFRLSQFPQGVDITIDLTRLSNKVIYDHARVLDQGNEYFKDIAVYLFCVLAERGHLEGLRALGVRIMEEGRNPNLGIELIEKASELGDVGAKLILGGYYLNGSYVEQDISKSLNFYRDAIDLGYPNVRTLSCHIRAFLVTNPHLKQAYAPFLNELERNPLWE